VGRAEPRLGLSPLRRRALEAFTAWQTAAGPWARWSVLLPLLGPGLDELPTSSRQHRPAPDAQAEALIQRLASELGAAAIDQPCLVVLELKPELGLRVAAGLARRGLARPLPLIARWPYAHAVLPTRRLVDTAIAEAHDLLAAPAASHVALVLDADRGQPLAGRSTRDPRADNRYALVAEDFPDRAALAAGGIQRVLDLRAPGAIRPALLADRVYPAWAAIGLRIEAL
jgi:hypothetical protein